MRVKELSPASVKESTDSGSQDSNPAPSLYCCQWGAICLSQLSRLEEAFPYTDFSVIHHAIHFYKPVGSYFSLVLCLNFQLKNS